MSHDFTIVIVVVVFVQHHTSLCDVCNRCEAFTGVLLLGRTLFGITHTRAGFVPYLPSV